MTRRDRHEAEEADAVDEIVEQWRTERPDLDPSPIGLFGRIHRTYSRYHATISRGFESHGINSAAFDVLAALRRSGIPYQASGAELAQGSLLSSAGVTFRLDRLEQAGLIERERDKTDRRVVYSRLSPEGLELIDVAIADHLKIEHQMLSGLTADEQAQLSRLLKKLERSIVTTTIEDE